MPLAAKRDRLRVEGSGTVRPLPSFRIDDSVFESPHPSPLARTAFSSCILSPSKPVRRFDSFWPAPRHLHGDVAMETVLGREGARARTVGTGLFTPRFF